MPKVLITGDMNISGLARALQGKVTSGASDSPWMISESGFNCWQTEPLAPDSSFHRERPDFLIVVLSSRVISEMGDLPERISSNLEALAASHGQSKVLFTNLLPDMGLLQPQFESIRQQRIAAKINESLNQFQEENLWFHVLDFQGFAAQHGLRQLTDSRFESVARMYLNPKGANLFAEYIARNLKALTSTPKKVLVVDLDNTLWGGVLGEEGVDGIKCGGEGAGYSFLRFHKALLRLKANGILLAICSKNNESDVLEAFREHPDLKLRIADFAAYRVNWLPKPQNLKSLADELNLGLSSFVFFDDSAHECEAVRQALPEVDVIQAPDEPADYVKVLSEYGGFDVFRVTDEDRKRSRQYADEAQRQVLKRQSLNIADFYASLEMKAIVKRVDEKSLVRVHQLINKTNQFNLTTERIDEAQLRAMLADPDTLIYTLTLSDKLGESGLTGLVHIKRAGRSWTLRNLLMSCRIIGRTVEFAFMKFVAERAKEDQASEIRARFVPSQKNQVAAQYLEQAGFSREQGSEDGWIFHLPDDLSRLPKFYVNIQWGETRG